MKSFSEMVDSLRSTPGYEFGDRAAITFLMLDRLESLGRVSRPSVCEFHDDGCDLDAYAISSDGKSLSLFVTLLAHERTAANAEELARGAIKMFQVCSQELSDKMAALPEVSLFAERAAALRYGLECVSICVLVEGALVDKSFGQFSLANARVGISIFGSDEMFPSEADGARDLAFEKPLAAISVRAPGGCEAYLASMDASNVGRLYLRHGDAIVDPSVRPLVSPNAGLVKDIRRTIQKTPELVMAGNRGVTFLADAVRCDEHDGIARISEIFGLSLTDGYQTLLAASEAIKNNPNKSTGAALPVKIVVRPTVGDPGLARHAALQQHRQGKGCSPDAFSADPVIVKIAEAFDALDATERKNSSGCGVTIGLFKKTRAGTPCSVGAAFSKEELARASNAAAGLIDSVDWNDSRNLRVFVSRMSASQVAIDESLAVNLASRAIVFRRAMEILSPEGERAAAIAMARLSLDESFDWRGVWSRRGTQSAEEAAIVEASRSGLPVGRDVDPADIRNISPKVRIQVSRLSPRRLFALLSWARAKSQFTVAERSAIFRAALSNRLGGVCDIYTSDMVWSLLKQATKQGFKLRG